MPSQVLLLAPLRGVTIRTFRAVFSRQIREVGFAAAFAPFIPANPGLRVTDRLFAEIPSPVEDELPIVPQVITRHPDAMRVFLMACRDRGFSRVDLNAGCPFPMIRRRGRGSALLANPALLERLLETGCEAMGPGKFSVKTRLGIERPDELLKLMPLFNRYPLAALTVHARTAKQMYGGKCDVAAFCEVAASSTNPVIYNGDAEPSTPSTRLLSTTLLMIGRGFVRALGRREDSAELLAHYIDASGAELCGDRPVLGRIKELLAYWTEADDRWRRLWPMVKICRTVDELRAIVRPWA